MAISHAPPRAGEYGLSFLAEAIFGFFDDPRLSLETKGLLDKLSGGDVVTLEQYLDFVRCRSFRQTLLCRNNVVGRDRGLW